MRDTETVNNIRRLEVFLTEIPSDSQTKNCGAGAILLSIIVGSTTFTSFSIRGGLASEFRVVTTFGASKKIGALGEHDFN